MTDGTAKSEKYAKPPIAEALVDVRFAPSLSEKLLRRVIDRVKPRYARAEEQVEVEFSFNLEAAGQEVKQQFSGARFLSEDGADILVLSKGSIVISRIAPYAGWTALRARVVREIEELRKAAADRRFSRLGVRYVNRIDVPLNGTGFSPEPYLTVFPGRPPILAQGAAQGYTVSLAGCAVGEYMVNVNSGIVAPQLIGHGALLVDVDAYIEADMDGRALVERLDGVRGVKNAVFESLITDEARRLFA